MNDQQAERVKKNILQKSLTFTARARQLMVEEPHVIGLFGPVDSTSSEFINDDFLHDHPSQKQALSNNFKGAFSKNVKEFNSYSAAAFSSKLRVDSGAALSLYGFKAPWATLNIIMHRRFRLRITRKTGCNKLSMYYL